MSGRRCCKVQVDPESGFSRPSSLAKLDCRGDTALTMVYRSLEFHPTLEETQQTDLPLHRKS